MAIVKNGFTRGRIGPITYSERNGVQISKALSKKEHYDMSIASVDSSSVFGKASNLACYFRESMYTAYNNYHDGAMSTRLTGLTVECLRPTLDETNLNFNLKKHTFKRLHGFEFNIKSPLSHYLLVPPMIDYTATNHVHICLPAMSETEFIFAQSTSRCRLVLTCGLFDLENGFFKDSQSQAFEIQRNFRKPVSPTIYATFALQPGCLCMIGISLEFYKNTFTGDMVINNKQFNPGAILSTEITDGVIDKSVTKKWRRMLFKTGLQRFFAPPAPPQLLLGSPSPHAA